MNLEEILELLDDRQFKKLKDILETMHPVDIVDLIHQMNKKQMILTFRLLEKEEAADVFTDMDGDMREELINALTDDELEEIMDEMYLDDAVDVIEELPANVVKRILKATDEDARQKINTLLKYPEDSAGSIMNVEYVSFQKDMTVEEAILKIRQVGINRETIYTCYVTEKRKLVGVVDIKDLLTAGESRLIEDIMDEGVVYARTWDDQEEVAKMIRKYGFISIPIIDHENCLVGIVTVDDAMDVLRDETTEDFSLMAGVNPNEESYFETSVFQHVKSRLPWLMLLMLSATVSGEILGHYEAALVSMPILTTFVPMLTGTGGNSGSQSSTTIIRALTIGEVRLRDVFKVIMKELFIAIGVSVPLAIVNGVRIFVMYDHDIMLAIALGITMVAVVILAKTIGCTMPLLAKRLGLDPAIMAAPLISTIMDICTLMVYFKIVTVFFHI